MVSDDGNRVGCSLNILTPFSESENDCKKFSVIDVIVPFGGEKSAREVGAGMKVAIDIAL